MFKVLSCFFFCLYIAFSQNNLKLNFKISPENPSNFIVNELTNNKIIMLGEAPHNNIILYYSLINILNKWLDNAKKTVDNKLSLILEKDSISAEIIDSYIKSGNDSLIKTTIIPTSYYEDFEFYINLKKFQDKIDSINSVLEKKISFNVRGFEENSYIYPNYLINSIFLKQTKHENELWFINERDINLSKKIISYRKKNINENILIYYGSGHLQNGLTNKNLDFDDINENESYGYYLAYYLKKEFGDTNVLTLNQLCFYRDMYPVFFKDYPDYKFEKPTLSIPQNISDSTKNNLSDFYIFYPYILTDSHPFNFVFSNSIIKYYKEIVCTIEKESPSFRKYNISNFYDQMLYFTYFITGKYPKDCLELENLIDVDTYSFILFYRIDSYEFKKEIYNIYLSYSNWKIKLLLYELGFNDENFIDNKLDTIEWYNKVWLSILPKLKFINCIGIYWIGYPDEKELAKKYLVEYSGQDYDEPVKYLQWYRKNILGVDYEDIK